MNGPSQNAQAECTAHRQPATLWWLAVILGLVAVRFALPFRGTDTTIVHEAVVDSLLHRHNWGRQALVGALEYPLLPTLGLLLARVAVGSGLAARLLLALCQAWAFSYLLRLRPPGMRRVVFGVIALLAMAVLPDLRLAVLALDVNWLAAVPFCAAVYHVVRWFREGILRDAVLTAVNAALLVFCGLGGALIGLGILVVLVHSVHWPAVRRPLGTEGIPALIWSPLLYCVFLWVLWNWLILGDILFSFRQLWGALGNTPGFAVPGAMLRAAVAGPASLWGFALIAAATIGTGHRRVPIAMLGIAAATVVARALCLALGLFAGAGTLLVLSAGLAVFAALPGGRKVAAPSRRGRLLQVAATAGGCAVLLHAASLIAVPDPVTEGAFVGNAPTAEEITALIDRQWPHSRTAVHGVRLPALYHDVKENRFVSRVDFHEGVFTRQAQDEVMHLLVPPPDGRFYLSGTSVFSDIHRRGRPYLLLERQWPTGWQLWRCVIAPDRESNLRHLGAD